VMGVWRTGHASAVVHYCSAQIEKLTCVTDTTDPAQQRNSRGRTLNPVVHVVDVQKRELGGLCHGSTCTARALQRQQRSVSDAAAENLWVRGIGNHFAAPCGRCKLCRSQRWQVAVPHAPAIASASSTKRTATRPIVARLARVASDGEDAGKTLDSRLRPAYHYIFLRAIQLFVASDPIIPLGIFRRGRQVMALTAPDGVRMGCPKVPPKMTRLNSFLMDAARSVVQGTPTYRVRGE
jgi:hypothetical protein